MESIQKDITKNLYHVKYKNTLFSRVLLQRTGSFLCCWGLGLAAEPGPVPPAAPGSPDGTSVRARSETETQPDAACKHNTTCMHAYIHTYIHTYRKSYGKILIENRPIPIHVKMQISASGYIGRSVKFGIVAQVPNYINTVIFIYIYIHTHNLLTPSALNQETASFSRSSFSSVVCRSCRLRLPLVSSSCCSLYRASCSDTPSSAWEDTRRTRSEPS